MALFAIEVTGQVKVPSGGFLPSCTILSAAPIAVQLYTHPPAGGVNVVQRADGMFVCSFVFWSNARLGLQIGDIAGYLVDLGNGRMGCMMSSQLIDFHLEVSERATPVHVIDTDKNMGAWHAFASIRLDQKLEVLLQ